MNYKQLTKEKKAQIDILLDYGKEFTTLQAAINDNNSSIITLQRNYTDVNSSNFNKNRNITLDLNGQSLNLANYAIQVSAGTVKITNGTIETSGTKCNTVTATGGKLTVDKNANILSRFKTTTEYGTSALKVSGNVNIYGGEIIIMMGDTHRGVIAANHGTVKVKGTSHLIWKGSMGGGTFFYAKYGSICYENSVITEYNPQGHSNFTYVGNKKGSITKKEKCN